MFASHKGNIHMLRMYPNVPPQENKIGADVNVQMQVRETQLQKRAIRAVDRSANESTVAKRLMYIAVACDDYVP